MSDSTKSKSRRFFNLTYYTSTLLAVWTIIVAGLIVKEQKDVDSYVSETALSTAQAHLDKDKSIRFWGTAHGGVYVPINESTPPNPYLANISERDIETPSGLKLTLMNPEYMVRNMNETFSEFYGVSGHITSLKPLRPGNSPDQWEKKALLEFEKGKRQVIELISDSHGTYIRLMEPLFVQQGCLKCHGHQGYDIGDIRGGVGVSMPIDSIIKQSRKQFGLHVLSLVVLWFFGCIVISIGSQRLKKKTQELTISNIDLQREVTEHKLTEQLLIKESTFNVAIQDTSGAMIMVLNTEGQIVRFNQTCIQTSGYTLMEVKNHHFWNMLLPPQEGKKIKERFLAKKVLDDYEAPLITKDGQRRIIAWSNTIYWDPAGETEYIICTGIDVTEAKHLQEQLLHAEKLTAIGKLSASIAHEINNPLFGIRNVLARLREKAELSEENKEFAELALQECDRIKNLILDLQDFNRPTSGVMTTVPVNKIIDNMLLLSKKKITNKKIHAKKILADNVGEITAISDQIKQVVLNLIGNAIEATPPEGTITIETKQDNNKNVKIVVSDTGIGIAEKDKKHIFEPFFTTKSAVKGTGLGLSISYGIVKRHGGTISVESVFGQGTKFTITLPKDGKSLDLPGPQ